MHYLDLEDLLLIHAMVIDHSGGSLGVRDIGRLEAVVATQHQEVFGDQVYETTMKKAAAICRGIITDYPFTDGNKRSAMLSALTFLSLNEIELNMKDSEIEDFAVSIATEKLSIDEIAEWLESKK